MRCHAKSVERLIYKEHKKLNSIVLDDVEITNELGPLQKYTGKLWITLALEDHKAGVLSEVPGNVHARSDNASIM